MTEAAFGAQLARAAGAEATYTPPGGAAVATYAALERVTRQRADGTIERVTLAHLPAADVPAPVKDAVIAIGADTWRVDALDDADDAVSVVTVRRA